MYRLKGRDFEASFPQSFKDSFKKAALEKYNIAKPEPVALVADLERQLVAAQEEASSAQGHAKALERENAELRTYIAQLQGNAAPAPAAYHPDAAYQTATLAQSLPRAPSAHYKVSHSYFHHLREDMRWECAKHRSKGLAEAVILNAGTPTPVG